MYSALTRFAQTSSGTTCELNGEVVSCDELLEEAGGFLAVGGILFLIFFIIGLVGLVFWVISLIHVLSNEVDNKAMWIVLLLLLGSLGGIIYFFAVRRPFEAAKKEGGAAPAVAPAQQPVHPKPEEPPKQPPMVQ